MKIQMFLLLAFAFVHSAHGQEERKFVRKGTAEYEKGKFLESEIEYRRALDKDGKSFEGNFNLGNALFKQEKYDESMEQFENLATTQADKDRLSKIYHNIGNAHFAKQEFDKSIDAYKKALKNNPLDNDTRYNLIVAQKMLQQQQQQQQQQQDKKDEKKEQQEQQKEQPKPEPQQQQQQQQDMSKQDAERLLNAIQHDENELQKKKEKVKAGQKVNIEKNW